MDPFLGEIRVFGFNFAPQGWAQCNGQILSIAQNTALFSLLATTYGGDGVTTFALPNLQGRAPVHSGQGAGLPVVVQGEIGGAASVTLNTTQLPAHSHPVNCQSGNGTSDTPVGHFPAKDAGGQSAANATSSNATMAPTMIGNTGNNQPVPTQSPFLGLNFCIALVGVYPPRN